MSSSNSLPDKSAAKAQERRKRTIPVVMDRRGQGASQPTTPRPEKGERRRQVDPTTCERDYTDDEIEFMKAMDQYKRANRRPFPTWSEVLEVLAALGYRRVAPATALPGIQKGGDVPPKG